ncbi:MAG: hypothetical protein ACO3YA_03905 [Candidatus Nanopelagicaceae bacterium]|jgi:hypothetical protein
MRKYTKVAVIAISLMLAFPQTFASTLPDEQFQIPNPQEEQMRGYYINEMAESTQNTSTYVSTWVGDRIGWVSNDEAPTDVVICSSSSAPDCELRIIQQFLAVLPYCDSSATLTCIEELYAERNGEKLAIERLGTFPERGVTDFAADQSINLPQGTQPLLVRIKDAPHSQGDLYIYRGELTGFRSHRNGVAQPFNYRGFQAAVFAVKLQEDNWGTYRRGACGYLPQPLKPGESYRYSSLEKVDNTGCFYDEVSRFGPTGDKRGCVSNSTTQCAAPYPLPLDMKFGMKVRFQRPMTGWLHGRIEDPTVQYQSTSSGGSVVTMMAKPTKVPVFQVWKRYSELNQSLKDLLARRSYARISSWFAGAGGASNEDLATDTKKSITRHGGETFDAVEMENFLAWLPLAEDKAAAFPTIWAFRSMNSMAQRDSQQSRCLQDTSTLNGLVTTNSTLYLDGPPDLNPDSQTLDYKVAAPHLTPTGEVFQGTYNLVLKSSVARCLYNFTNAPISATVSVQNASGISTLATTVVSEKDGWLRLNASGFTFSTPIIRIKLTQESAPSEATTTPQTSETQKSVSKKKAILCIKGNKQKKVQGSKCPKGFKKA